MLHHIVTAEPRPEYRVFLRFSDGLEGEIDLAPAVREEGVFQRLQDASRFSRVRVGERGRYLEWPDDIDLCADALHERVAAAIAV